MKNKPFRFVQDKGNFKVVVFAFTLRNARKHIQQQAISCISYRTLKYVGEGSPSNGAGWLGAVADKEEQPAWMTEPVIWPETSAV